MKVFTRNLLALSVACVVYATVFYLPSWCITLMFMYIGFVYGIFVGNDCFRKGGEDK